MLLFKKPTKRQLSPATIRLPLGESPPYQSEGKKSKSKSPQKQIEHRRVNSISHHKGELNREYSISSQKQIEHRRVNSISHHKGELNREYSISPQKRREPNKSYTSHDMRETINEYYTPKPSKPYTKPKINWTTKMSMMTNHLKKTLKKNFFTKDKPIYRHLDLGESPPNQQSFGGNQYIKSIGRKIIYKPRRKPSNPKKNKK